MPMCFPCQCESAKIKTDDTLLWQYRTIESRCDACGAEFSHERVFALDYEQKL